jgi:hypothetical protein
MKDERDRPDTDVVITPQMIEAGAMALAETGEASSAYLAEVVFRAMMAAQQQALEIDPCAAADGLSRHHQS